VSAADRLAWLRLIRSENVGPITARMLVERFGGPAQALERLPHLARRGGRKAGLRIAGREEAEAEIRATEAAGAKLLTLADAAYPPLLARIEDAPPVLAVKGFEHLLAKPAVAVVGARNASANGARLAQRLAADLGEAGFVVVSGLARGIDSAAHRGSLASGTVAVLAGGIDVVYPPENRPLYDDIAHRGAILAELTVGTQPQAGHFPRRNRLISGLSLGVVVIEAAIKSGSLITARFALEQGREVFAVPGSPLDPRAQGCNRLIRQGAMLVESAADIVAELKPLIAGSREAPDERRPPPPEIPGDAELAAGRELITNALGPEPVDVDELLRQCQIPAPIGLTVLLELELAGRLQRFPGGKVALLVD